MRRSILMIILLAGVVTAAWAQWSTPQLVDSPYDTVGINTSSEWCPYITVDGQYLYFASGRRHNNDIFVSHRTDSGWSEPLMVPWCTYNGDERNPTVNATNDTLYFVSWSDTWDIFWSFRTGPCDTCWGYPQRMPEPINSTGIEFSVWATPDNQRLLFSSWRLAANAEDIYECRRDASTPTGWSDPVALPGELNTFDLESYPSMGYDTTELFFWGRYARLYRSVLTDSGWTRGDSLPDTINRVLARDPSEKTPCITPDGHRLYFSSSFGTPITNGAIWYSDRPSDVPHDQKPLQNREGGFRIEVYPNPASDRVTLSSAQAFRDVELYDILGRRIAGYGSRGGGASPLMWNLRESGLDLPSGVYILTAHSRTAKAAVQVQIVK